MRIIAITTSVSVRLSICARISETKPHKPKRKLPAGVTRSVVVWQQSLLFSVNRTASVTSLYRSLFLGSQCKTLAAVALWRRHTAYRLSKDGRGRQTDGRTDTRPTENAFARSGKRHNYDTIRYISYTPLGRKKGTTFLL